MSVGDFKFKRLKITSKKAGPIFLEPIKLIGLCDKVESVSGSISVDGCVIACSSTSGSIHII